MSRRKKTLMIFAILLLTAGIVWARGGKEEATATGGAAAVSVPGKFNEAPMLAAMVKAGTIPSVEKRLPKVPFVLKPLDGIGKYGGTLRTFNTNPNSWGDLQEEPETGNFLLRVLQDNTVVADIAKSYKLSDDFKSLTFYLREGMKWSNGDPLTADDFIFMWDLQKEGKVGTWGGGFDYAARLVKVDDYTIRAEVDEPRPNVLPGLAGWFGSDWGAFLPSTYFKKWHIKFNPDADKLAKEKGFDNWFDLMSWSLPYGGIQKDFNRPTTQPWVMKSNDSSLKVFERNPYYHVVDTAGNQLPYVDKIQTQVVDAETYQLKVASGEADVAWVSTTLDNITLYKENESKGGYTARFIPGINATEVGFRFNPLDPDPAKAKALSNKKFRQALSLAINRDEINKVLYYGQAVPRQATILPNASYYKKEWAEAYAKFDLAKANKMLDELGLDKKDKDGFRIGYDGKTLSFAIEYYEIITNPKILELVKEYWEAAGIKIQLLYEDRALWRSRRGASQYSIMPEMEAGVELFNYADAQSFGISGLYLNPWDTWLNADAAVRAGTQKLSDFPGGKLPGVEPPQEVKDVRDAVNKRAQTALYSKEYNQLSQKIFDINAEQLFVVGTVGMAPTVAVAKSNIGNVPKALPPYSEWQGNLNYFGNQLYFK